MRLTWKIIDEWRERRGLSVADLARRAGIPERTIYAGIRSGANLQAATKAVMRSIFPDEYAASVAIADRRAPLTCEETTGRTE